MFQVEECSWLEYNLSSMDCYGMCTTIMFAGFMVTLSEVACLFFYSQLFSYMQMIFYTILYIER